MLQMITSTSHIRHKIGNKMIHMARNMRRALMMMAIKKVREKFMISLKFLMSSSLYSFLVKRKYMSIRIAHEPLKSIPTR